MIELAIEGQAVELFSSSSLINELTRALGYTKFTARTQALGTTTAGLVALYAGLVTLVTPHSVPRVVANDADDDHVIAAAVAAYAELIVTGDRRHLLPIGNHRGIAIITVHEVFDKLIAEGKA